MTSQESNRLQFLWNASHALLSSTPNLSAFYMQRFHQRATENQLKLADGIKRKYCSYCGSIFVPGINCQTRLNANKRRRKQKRKQIVDIKDKYPKSVKRDNEIIQDDGSGTCKLRKATQEKRKIIHVQSDKTHSRQRADFKQKRQQYKNHLSYICNMCNRETRFTGSIMRDVSRPDQTETNKKISLWPKPHEMSTLSKKLITPSNPSSGSKSKKKKPKSQLQQFLAEEKERNNEKKDPSELLNLEDFLSSL